VFGVYLAVQMRDYRREVFVLLLRDLRNQLLDFR
jgi:DNA repair protein RadC